MRKFENMLNSYKRVVLSYRTVGTFKQPPVPALRWEWRFDVNWAVALVGNLNRNLTFASGFHARLGRGEGMLRSRCFCPLSQVRSQQWLKYLSGDKIDSPCVNFLNTTDCDLGADGTGFFTCGELKLRLREENDLIHDSIYGYDIHDLCDDLAESTT